MAALRPSLASRFARAFSLTAAVLLVASCGDLGTAGPRSLSPGHASFSILPSFQQIPAGGPNIRLARIAATLTSPTGEVSASEARFTGDSAVLSFDVVFTGASAEFTLELTAFDAQGVIVFHSIQKVLLRQGVNEQIPTPVLQYVGPDAGVTVIHVSPGTTQLAAGGSTTLTVTGAAAGGQNVSPIRVGWSSRDPSVATVDENGIVSAGAFQGSTWIIARTATNVADSASVKVRAPVAKITVNPATLTLARAQTVPIVADIRDAGNHLIDDRPPTWTSSDQSVATVSATGVVQGIRTGTATITALVEGKSATTAVQVVSPVDHIDLTPTSFAFVSIGQTGTLTAKIVARTGASVDGITASFSSTNPSVATVDSKGTVTAVGNGSAAISVTADGVVATAPVTLKQVVASVTLSPKTATVSALGDTRTFTAAVVDAAGTPIQSPNITWTSSDPTIATVVNGTATGKATGSVSITASVDGKSDVAAFNVSPIPRLLLVIPSKPAINIGQTATLSAQIADANGNTLGPMPATYTTTTPNLISISGNVVTGLVSGVAHIVGTGGGFTGTADIKVNPPTSLNVIPAAAEKMPSGFGFFGVTNATNPVTWTVNGIPGGSSTYGTIDVEGYYQAPQSVPVPSSFDICAVQSSPTITGCSHVTIRAIPSAGGDFIVINDLNFIDEGDISVLDNRTFVKNLVAFTPVGARSAATKVLFQRGHSSQCAVNLCTPAEHTTARSDMLSVGITGFIDDNSPTIGSIPSDVRVVFLLTPTTSYSVAELNTLKSFAAEGGRIVFIGDNVLYYVGFSVENDLLLNLGSEASISDGFTNCGGSFSIAASQIRTHQTTTGVTGLNFPCGSGMSLGPNDYPIAFGAASSSSGFLPVISAFKVDLIPFSTGSTFARNSARTLRRPTRTVTVPTIQRDSTGYGPGRRRP